MKKFFLSFLLFTAGLKVSLAQVSINSDGSDPDGSAMLEVKATDKGVLLPRLTLSQRDAIASPAEGLMVFCTDCGSEGSLSIFSNGSWKTFSPCSISAPTAGTNTVTLDQVLWTWNSVAGATGYKWNTTDDYSTAIYMGTSLTKSETGFTCGTTYNRFVWARNSCSVSTPVTLTETIPATVPATPVEGTHVASKTQITWNWNTVPDALGYRWNSINDFTTATEMGLTTTKAEGSLTCETLYTRYVWAYNGCGYATPLTLSQSTLACWICGDTLAVNHLASGGVAPVDKEVTYGTVNNIPGETSKCWIT